MARPAAGPLIRAASVWIVEHVGTKMLRMSATENTKKKKIKKTKKLGCKPTSFRTNPRILPGRKLRAQASSQRPQAPRSWNQGTSAQAQGPGHKQQGQMNFLDDVRKRLFGGVRSVFC